MRGAEEHTISLATLYTDKSVEQLANTKRKERSYYSIIRQLLQFKEKPAASNLHVFERSNNLLDVSDT